MPAHNIFPGRGITGRNSISPSLRSGCCSFAALRIASITPAEVGQIYHLGMGGSGTTVPLEARVTCMRGAMGLAHGMSVASGDSQFFFNLSDNHRLDNQYTVFGRVIQGLEVMDQIHQGDRIKSVRRVTKSAAGQRRGPAAR